MGTVTTLNPVKSLCDSELIRELHERSQLDNALLSREDHTLLALALRQYGDNLLIEIMKEPALK